MKNFKINYSQCWEDPVVLRKALSVKTGDVVLSITSGGCNSLALLLDDPAAVIAIDKNPAQNYLLELKIKAIQYLPYGDCLELLGLRDSTSRLRHFEQLAPKLSAEARAWWQSNKQLIKLGVMASGRFERYIAFFRRFLLPLVHRTSVIESCLNQTSLEKQINFYHTTWNCRRWRMLFNIFFNKILLSLFGRYPGAFVYADTRSISRHFFERFEYAMTRIPIKDNYFLRYMLTGSYIENSLPVYLDPENFKIIRARANRVKIENGELRSYLLKAQDNSFDAINLSDIFETMSEVDTVEVFRQIARVGKAGARIAYWNNLVHREPPPQLLSLITAQKEAADELYRADRAFMYSAFFVNTIKKSSL